MNFKLPLNASMSEESVNKKYTQLLRYCAYQERCTNEVVQKGKRIGLDKADISKLVLQLSEDGYLDDVRFAKSYALGKFRLSNWGRMKIRAKLFNKGIDSQLIETAVSEIEEDQYRKKIMELIARKNKESEKQVSREKVFRYLASKGYEFALINECLGANVLYSKD